MISDTTSPSSHFLLCLQLIEAHSESARDQEWLDHLYHILQQKVRLNDTNYSFLHKDRDENALKSDNN